MKVRYMIISSLIIALSLLFHLEARDDSILRVKALGRASPDITQKTKARAAALRAARVEGYKKLAAAAGFSSTYHLGNKKYIRVEAFLSGAQVVDKRYISDHEVEVTMEIPRAQVIEQFSEVKRKFYEAQISEVKRKIRVVEAQMGELKSKLAELKEQLRKLEEGRKVPDESN
jgi:polyhydroxyalkanoate synthesis regulator phasin